MTRRMWISLGVLLVGFFAVRCGTVSVGNLNSSDFQEQAPSVDCTSVTAPSFATDIIPLMSQPIDGTSCDSIACHGDSPPAGGLNLDVDNEATGAAGIYDNLVPDQVDTTTPEASALARNPIGIGVHDTILQSTDTEYQTLFCWIENGAPNN